MTSVQEEQTLDQKKEWLGRYMHPPKSYDPHNIVLHLFISKWQEQEGPSHTAEWRGHFRPNPKDLNANDIFELLAEVNIP